MKKITLSIALIALGVSLRAQTLTPTVVSTSGAFFSNGSGMLSTTIGELAAVTTLSSANNFLTQGFQQPWDFGVSVPELPSHGFSIEVYPNPGNGLFNVALHSDADTKLSLKVYDILGHEVSSEEINHTSGFGTYEMNLKNLTAGIYLLEIMSKETTGNNSSKTIKKIQIIN